MGFGQGHQQPPPFNKAASREHKPPGAVLLGWANRVWLDSSHREGRRCVTFYSGSNRGRVFYWNGVHSTTPARLRLKPIRRVHSLSRQMPTSKEISWGPKELSRPSLPWHSRIHRSWRQRRVLWVQMFPAGWTLQTSGSAGQHSIQESKQEIDKWYYALTWAKQQPCLKSWQGEGKQASILELTSLNESKDKGD